MATDFLVKQGRVMGGVRLVTDADVAHQTDLTNIRETGTTSSQAISAGTYFYLNGTLVRAKVAIASGATFTLNTNYEVVTAGALNELKDAIDASGYTVTANTYLGSISHAQVAKSGKKLMVNVVFATTSASTSGQAIFSILKNGQAISCDTGFALGLRLQNDGNSAYCPITASGVVSAGPSYGMASGKIYHFNVILNLL